MERSTKLFLPVLISSIFLFSACSKDESIYHGPGNGQGPGNPDSNPTHPNTPNPDSIYVVKVKASIMIGDLLYDSIPASLHVISWDSANRIYQSEVSLAAGANSIRLPKSHAKYQLRLSKWGVMDEINFTKAQIQEGTLISLGGTREAKKLKLEEGFLFAAGAYRPDNKTIYSYNGNGTLKQIDYYQKKPQHSDLKLYHYDQFVYVGNRVDRIIRFDENGVQRGVTEFTYNANGKIVNMHQDSYGNETYAAIEYAYSSGNGDITIDYLYNNGNAMEYVMKIIGGNRVEDHARSSTGGSEGGTYGYDFNINPFAHIGRPDLYLSTLSKNNMISQQKGYSGSIPSGVPYRYEYSYDNDGYPTELVKSYKSYVTGDHLYKTRTVYSY